METLPIKKLAEAPKGFPELELPWSWGSDDYVYYLLKFGEPVGGITFVGGSERYGWALYGVGNRYGWAQSQEAGARELAEAAGVT